MKYKTALRQSQASVKFLSVVIVGLLGLAYKYPGKATLIPLMLVTCYCLMDAYNIYRIKRHAARDPSYLNQKLQQSCSRIRVSRLGGSTGRPNKR